MSGFQTHALIGGVGGLALTHSVPALAMQAAHLTGQRPLIAEIGIVALSALLATWPDIDEPHSFMGRNVHTVVTLAGSALGGMLGWSLAPHVGMQPLTTLALGVIGGTILGALVGMLLLKGIRTAAGGHRRGTHSLFIGALLVGIGIALWMGGMWLTALMPLALAWGQLLHDMGDVVTPTGVPIFWPLSNWDLHLLPAPLRRYGELVIAVVAILVGLAIIGRLPWIS